jgi:uncharacterized protein (TIGR03000 family)
MYSIVMLTAMASGADVTPPAVAAPVVIGAAPVIGGGSGCSGTCYGSVAVSSCYGSSCHGCYGSSCHGGVFKRSGGFLGHKSSCHGCSGYSCSGYNCFSSGWSCSGCSGYSCSGCSGFAGYAGSCHGCYGISYGSSWGPPVGMLPYTLHGYNSGSDHVYGPSFPVVGSNYTDSHAVWGRTHNPNLPPVVVIPVDAKLYVDGKLAPGSGPERAFYTPPLAAGKQFFYEVKAELLVDGQVVVDEKKVIVEAGQTVTESFPKLVAAVAKANSVAGK